MWQSFKNIYHLMMAVVSNIFYGSPAGELTVIGVTGTDGKTTTVHLIYHILKRVNKNVSMISSTGAYMGGKQYDIGFHVTTPSSWKLQSFLKKAAFVARGSVAGFPPASARPPSSARLRAVGSPSTRTTPRYLVLEVTSHALDQYRVWGIDFAVGVLTNVTREHLDYHKTYENYVKTKARLLIMAKVAVVNRDDNSFGIISNFKFPISNFQLITYGIKKRADVTPKNFPFKTKLAGEFNQYNILAAVAVCRALGISDQTIIKAVASFELPIGRMEVVHEDEFIVMIDFAHTPNALEQILMTVRPSIEGRLIHVFGSAGERDRQKRPEMGKISAKYADVIVVTAEDPRSESVNKIISEIEAGIKNSQHEARNPKQIQIYKIQNRQGAINFAVKMARRGDLVLITGKGHERSMNYGKGEIPWSEHEAVRRALGKR